MKPTILVFVFALLSLFSLLAPTGCEQITQQNKQREDSQTQRARDAQAAAAKAQQLELAYKETQAREERALREKLETERIKEQGEIQREEIKQRTILERARQELRASIGKFGLAALAIVGLIILTIWSYLRHRLALAQLHANKEATLEISKLIIENWGKLSEEQGIAFLQGIAPPPPQLPPAPENSPEEEAPAALTLVQRNVEATKVEPV